MPPRSPLGHGGQGLTAQLILLAGMALGCDYGCEDSGGDVRVRVKCRHKSVEFVCVPPPRPPDRGGGEDPGEDDRMDEFLAAHFFGELEADIVLSVEERALPALAIKAKLGLGGEDVPTRLKMALSFLIERGILVNGRDGYAPADPRVVRIARLRRGLPDKANRS